MAARYHFLSDFTMTSSRDAVWTTLSAVEEWPAWWRWLKPGAPGFYEMPALER